VIFLFIQANATYAPAAAAAVQLGYFLLSFIK
jgi:hypothetical protein